MSCCAGRPSDAKPAKHAGAALRRDAALAAAQWCDAGQWGNDGSVAMLEALGFAPRDAGVALTACGGVVDHAADWLTATQWAAQEAELKRWRARAPKRVSSCQSPPASRPNGGYVVLDEEEDTAAAAAIAASESGESVEARHEPAGRRPKERLSLPGQGCSQCLAGPGADDRLPADELCFSRWRRPGLAVHRCSLCGSSWDVLCGQGGQADVRTGPYADHIMLLQ